MSSIPRKFSVIGRQYGFPREAAYHFFIHRSIPEPVIEGFVEVRSSMPDAEIRSPNCVSIVKILKSPCGQAGGWLIREQLPEVVKRQFTILMLP